MKEGLGAGSANGEVPRRSAGNFVANASGRVCLLASPYFNDSI